MRIIWGSDFHLGLRTETVDRTPEIVRIITRMCKYAHKSKADAMVLGGDIFDKNNPSEGLIATFIMLMNLMAKLDIPVYIIAGNHDSVADPERLSCLSFIKKLKNKYPNFHLIEDIKCVKVKDTDLGPVHFTFYPHITRALLSTKKESVQKLGTQKYIDHMTDKIFKKIGLGGQNYVFSHLNVRGIIAGSEENLLKKSEVFLPHSITDQFDPTSGYVKPIIIQGHIHKKQQLDNIHIVGSPLHCGFGEDDQVKYFLDMEIPESQGETKFRYIDTRCTKFYEVNCSLGADNKKYFLDIPEIKDFLSQVEEGSVVKISPTLSQDNAGHDWKKVREEVAELTKSTVKDIVPKIIRHNVTRNPKQKSGLKPVDSVKVWLKTNQPPRMKMRYKIAKELIDAHI